MVAREISAFSPSGALLINRFMFAIAIAAWPVFLGVALARRTLVLGRVAPLMLIFVVAAGYLTSRGRSAFWHRVLGITANALVVGGVVYLFASRAIGGSWLDASLVVFSAGVFFAYPLFLLTRGSGESYGRSGARA